MFASTTAGAAALSKTSWMLILVRINLYHNPCVAFFWCPAKAKTSSTKFFTRFLPFNISLSVNSSCLLARSLSVSKDKSSVPLALILSFYKKETMCARLIPSRCLPLDVNNLKTPNKAVRPRITNLMFIPSIYLLLLSLRSTSTYKSR